MITVEQCEIDSLNVEWYVCTANIILEKFLMLLLNILNWSYFHDDHWAEPSINVIIPREYINE